MSLRIATSQCKVADQIFGFGSVAWNLFGEGGGGHYENPHVICSSQTEEIFFFNNLLPSFSFFTSSGMGGGVSYGRVAGCAGRLNLDLRAGFDSLTSLRSFFEIKKLFIQKVKTASKLTEAGLCT